MRLIITKASLFIILTITIVNMVYGNMPENINFFSSDSTYDNLTKVESLLKTSEKLESSDITFSLEAVLQAQNIAIIINDQELLARCNYQKGVVLSKNNMFVESLENLKKALAYYEESNNKASTANILLEIGNTYQNDKQFKKSLIFYNSSLADYSLLNDSLGIAICHTQIGESNMLSGDINSALNNYLDAIDISLNNNFNSELAINYLNLAKLKITSGNYPEAELHLKNALEIVDNESLINLKAETNFQLSEYYFTIGDTISAIYHLKENLLLTDSIAYHNANELESFYLGFSNNNLVDNDDSPSTALFLSTLFIIIVVIVFLLLKIKKRAAIHKIIIDKCEAEIKAFESRTSNLNEKVELKTKERLEEIDKEINNNLVNQISISNSQKNLDRVNYLKDMFLSKISHEIRTPLNGILGFAEILETQLAIEEEDLLFEFASSITESGMSLVSLLNNILDISRLNSNNMKLDFKKLSINELIQSIVDRYTTEANLKGLKLIYDSKEIPEIQTDSQIFTKILSLILDNAIKFTEKGFIKISHDYNESVVNIYIKDTGIGIDKAYIHQVFEPYRQESLGYSTSYQGAGLGLPLAKKMANKLDGEIMIESEKGIGTTLILNLPLVNIETENEVHVVEEIEK
ncbi:MAG: tetratricopeptide repeat-containing sensor histidine kinase, partial [Bacteroidetes bacterium]|nr:tetratricopeptide repeat-containing sensor histidine kinase [Bacteroidota bacterium]